MGYWGSNWDTVNQTFSITVAGQHFTVGTKYFFDIALARLNAAGTCTIRNLQWFLQEY
ncbi:MAG: hypothetical protein WAN47_07215 [Nitrosotalea sp.]